MQKDSRVRPSDVHSLPFKNPSAGSLTTLPLHDVYLNSDTSILRIKVSCTILHLQQKPEETPEERERNILSVYVMW